MLQVRGRKPKRRAAEFQDTEDEEEEEEEIFAARNLSSGQRLPCLLQK